MITAKLQIILIIGMVCYFFLIYHFLKKQQLLLKYVLLWIFAGIVMTILVIVPSSLQWLADRLGIYTDINLLFLLGILFSLMIVMSLTAIVSKQSNTNKRLIQELALLEQRVRELEGDDAVGDNA